MDNNDKEIFTVAQLNQTARELLEEALKLVWVKGELSNVALPRSGHIYFTLKDEHAQVRCAMFKGSNHRLKFTPADGMEVLVRANVSLYEPRGDYQLIITHMEEWGLGKLQQAFEALKAKLQAEGLFEQSHKKPFPPFPKHIGVITSHTGAAIQDILSVLKRRYPIAPITIYHTQVQGKTAAKDIIKAIKLANKHQTAEVLILARGGGSLEDLWCFNDEQLARVIFDSTIPIVTGIGHEIDFTIADFVADLRAPTPSAAAETVTPDTIEIIRIFEQKKLRLIQAILRILQHHAQKIDSLEKQLIHPGKTIQQTLIHVTHLQARLALLMTNTLQRYKNSLSIASAKLHTVSPLATLARGYAIVTTLEGNVVVDTKDLKIEHDVRIQLGQGTFISTVKEIISQ
ncbi:MAG: exodeoxyribonuclease VII large subunit [Gammaproteobacteria bacterium]|jgi:exodeoxyribonuclease VII large subunit|nr:exodeoxyribonuclease VII large subunit [Gammaproteobacteria bacterium]